LLLSYRALARGSWGRVRVGEGDRIRFQVQGESDSPVLLNKVFSTSGFSGASLIGCGHDCGSSGCNLPGQED